MTFVRGGPAGPDGLGGAYLNEVESDRSAWWFALGGAQGVIKGGALTGVSGQMSIDVAPIAALVSELDVSGVQQDRGYFLWADVSTRVDFLPHSVAARNDALVAAFVDTEDGPVGSGGLSVGPQIVAVPGVSGTTTTRTNSQIISYLGRGGFTRLADVPITATDTQINMANIVKPSPYNVADTGWINLTPVSGTGVCRYRCVRGVVSVQIALTGVTSVPNGGNGSIVATGGLPAAYRPSQIVYQAGNGGANVSTLGHVEPDGSILQWNNTGAAVNVARMTFTYLKE